MIVCYFHSKSDALKKTRIFYQLHKEWPIRDPLQIPSLRDLILNEKARRGEETCIPCVTSYSI